LAVKTKLSELRKLIRELILETDERMEGDGKEDKGTTIAQHLRPENDLALGDQVVEDDEDSTIPEWLERDIKRFMLQEYPAGAGMVDPIDPMGFYSKPDPDRDLRTDIHGYWYKSPARAPGSEGDPYRSDDPWAQLGFHVRADDPTASPPGATSPDEEPDTDETRDVTPEESLETDDTRELEAV